jgi:Family of unknown function (DUF6444)
MGDTLVAPLPMPAGVPLDAASWDQTPLAVRQVIVQLLAVIQHQAARIAVLEARLSLTSRTSDRPPSSDPPFVKQPSSFPDEGDSRSEAGTSWASPSAVGAHGDDRGQA